MGADGAAGGPLGARRVPTRPAEGPWGRQIEGPVRVCKSIVHRFGTVERPVLPNQGSRGNPSEPNMARRDPTEDSPSCPVSVYD